MKIDNRETIIDNKLEELKIKCSFNKRREGSRSNRKSIRENPLLDQYEDQEDVSFSFCDFETALDYPEISDGSYVVTLVMEPTAVRGLPSDVSVVNYETKFTSRNPNYTTFLLVWRYFMLALSIVSFYLFSQRMKLVNERQVLIE